MTEADFNRRDAETQRLNKISESVIGACIEVHREVGPGLLESAYEECLAYEFSQRGLSFERQKPLPVVYKAVRLDGGYRMDFLVENSVVVELKTVEALLPVHDAQVLTYLKLAKMSLGLLINFNVPLLKHGLKRIVNNFSDSSASQRLCGSN